ncbi:MULTISPECIES: DNA repair protein RecO [unclassified Granulicatella]|uniref:DNA repair protein RecO n=1 Tax=unclassified Granulicatella TaxID=2630493 RepID=UPI001073A6ED|nr:MULTISPECIES: DNA repair protein RecO [unclassified Granulicatella]MBF0780684.1 DNA repair protein RecO [Granulicatella sp. 19428wC4_WM01]TFU94226.1 DNA repair protein RecO [Granulicatella sp. WM01]
MFEDSFHGIILFSQPYKETDMIVKIFTLEFGKQMFFVRQVNKNQSHPLKMALLPFSQVEMVGKINRNGLSFLKEPRQVAYMKRAQDDLLVQAYASYMVGLADAVVDDKIVHKEIYYLLKEAFDALNRYLDVEIVTMMFELRIIRFFGVTLQLQHCVITGQMKGPFDFSFKYGGVLHHTQWDKDNFRLHIDANAMFIIQKLEHMHFKQIGDIQLSAPVKLEMRRMIDAIYEEYVGIHLKSKSFIDNMINWYYD